MMRIGLVRDILDNQLVDVRQQNAGKVDGIVLEQRADGSACVRYIEVGPITLARRVNRRFGDWVARWDRRFGEGRGAPIRIPITRIALDEPSLRVDLAADETPIMAFEHWLRRTIVRRIPWS
jgi:hypothetical protein